MSDPLRLSILDQSPVPEGASGAQALQNTIDLAQLADRLGYHRYWLAEHHGGPMLAGPSPEALIGPIAAATERIRVGSGGVMLPHYSPFKVAETFSLLAGIFPGAHRPRARTRGRHRSDDDLRAAARPPRGRAGRLPTAALGAARLPRRDAARGPPLRAAGRDAAGTPGAAGAMAARVLRTERRVGRRARAAVRVRGLHQLEGRTPPRASTGNASPSTNTPARPAWP